MYNSNKYEPILITGVERSGSTIISRILDMCGVWSGDCNNMFENGVLCNLNNAILNKHDLHFPKTELLEIPVSWEDNVHEILHNQKYGKQVWMLKHSGLARLWPIWNYAFPDAKWLIVRRRTGDIIQSCMKTGYMRLFKDVHNLALINCNIESEGWLWWVRQYEEKFVEMIKAGLNCRIIWPERMVTGNYEQMYETIEWLGLKWNSDIPKVIDPLLNKSREVFYENNITKGQGHS